MKTKDNILDIDPDRLDEEWISQPSTFAEYAEKLAEAKREMDVAKGELEVVEAELSKSIRLHPDKYSIEKLTEPIIASTILLQKEYKTAHASFIEAKYNVALVQAMVDALDHKKKALESMVYLWGANYYSTPQENKTGENGQKRVREAKRDRAFGSKRREVNND